MYIFVTKIPNCCDQITLTNQPINQCLLHLRQCKMLTTKCTEVKTYDLATVIAATHKESKYITLDPDRCPHQPLLAQRRFKPSICHGCFLLHWSKDCIMETCLGDQITYHYVGLGWKVKNENVSMRLLSVSKNGKIVAWTIINQGT